jgi:hypothetical protein
LEFYCTADKKILPLCKILMKCVHPNTESKRILTKKVNVYLPSLMMKVPDHVYVLGDTYTCHT